LAVLGFGRVLSGEQGKSTEDQVEHAPSGITSACDVRQALLRGRKV
jgi:hypothetical protein